MPLSSVLGASSVIKPGVCTSTTRPTVPYTGQLIFETDTSRLAVWTGSAWQYESAAAGPPGLVYITGASFSSVSSVSIPDNTFTSTHKNYSIVFDCEFSTNANLQMRMRAAGTDNTSGTYNWSLLNSNTGGTVNGSGTASDSLWRFGYGASATNRSAAITFTIYGPQTATITRVSAYGFSADSSYNASATISAAGVFTGTNQFDSLSFIAPFTSGAYRVYGYTDS